MGCLRGYIERMDSLIHTQLPGECGRKQQYELLHLLGFDIVRICITYTWAKTVYLLLLSSCPRQEQIDMYIGATMNTAVNSSDSSTRESGLRGVKPLHLRVI